MENHKNRVDTNRNNSQSRFDLDVKFWKPIHKCPDYPRHQ